MRNITVGVVQMAIKQMPSEVKGSWDGLSKDEIRRIDEEVVSANLDQAEKLVRKTKEQGVDVVLLSISDFFEEEARRQEIVLRIIIAIIILIIKNWSTIINI